MRSLPFFLGLVWVLDPISSAIDLKTFVTKNDLEVSTVVILHETFSEGDPLWESKIIVSFEQPHQFVTNSEFLKQRYLEGSLIVTKDNLIGNWSSDILSKNQMLILKDLPRNGYPTISDAENIIVIMGLDGHLHYNSQVYVVFIKEDEVRDIVEVSLES